MPCNPNWKEISENLEHYETAIDRPDIVVKVFHQKVVTWTRSRPWKATRESCTHVPSRSRMIFPPALLPCRTSKLRPAAAEARAIAVARRQAVAPRCCHRHYNGASALLPPPLPRSCCESWSAAGGRRYPRSGGPARGGRMLARQQPDQHLLYSVRAEGSSASSREL